LHAKWQETRGLATSACAGTDFSGALCAGRKMRITFLAADSFTEQKEFFFETGCETPP
jgi:hypothetical protein